MSQPFDFNQALTGQDGILMPLIKQLTEAAITAELEQHLAESNEKNGTTVKTGAGQFILDTPRDRSGTFEPQLVKKNQTQLTPEIDHKILSLFSLGASYSDMQQHIRDLYGIEVSNGTISANS